MQKQNKQAQITFLFSYGQWKANLNTFLGTIFLGFDTEVKWSVYRSLIHLFHLSFVSAVLQSLEILLCITSVHWSVINKEPSMYNIVYRARLSTRNSQNAIWNKWIRKLFVLFIIFLCGNSKPSKTSQFLSILIHFPCFLATYYPLATRLLTKCMKYVNGRRFFVRPKTLEI